jgi:archaellum component FlaC
MSGIYEPEERLEMLSDLHAAISNALIKFMKEPYEKIKTSTISIAVAFLKDNKVNVESLATSQVTQKLKLVHDQNESALSLPFITDTIDKDTDD